MLWRPDHFGRDGGGTAKSVEELPGEELPGWYILLSLGCMTLFDTVGLFIAELLYMRTINGGSGLWMAAAFVLGIVTFPLGGVLATRMLKGYWPGIRECWKKQLTFDD